MYRIRLRRHGENVKPHYLGGNGVAGRAGLSTDAERPDGEVSGVVRRFKKGDQASPDVTSIALIKAAYAEAIEYTGIAIQVRGVVIFLAVFAACGVALFAKLAMVELYLNGPEDFLDYIFLVLGSVYIAWAFYFLLYAIRTELFQPEDEPVIFDRRHRKVYRLFREVQPGITGLFRHWPIHAAEYDWDLIDAEHNAVLTTTGSSVIRYHSLIFLVRKSATDPTIIDSFPVGNTLHLGELTVAPVWEHIRRFMEQHGPHLPLNEFINNEIPPQSLWESWVHVAPVGPSYKRRWKNVPAFMAFIHLLFPFFVPLFFFWGIFNWLSYKTAIKVSWPQEVLDACGQMLPSAESERSTYRSTRK